jgi:predicted PurR-regulated permease PerM
MKTALAQKHFLLILLILVIILTIAILYPFLSVIILAFAFTIVLNPIYLWIDKNITKNINWLSSLITIILFLTIICVPLYFAGTIVFDQTQNAYNSLTQTSSPDKFIQTIDSGINKLLPEGFTFNTYEKIVNLVSFLSNNITGFISSSFKAGIMFFITIIALFYSLKDGVNWRKSLMSLSPISDEHFTEISDNLNKQINHVFRGSFLVAIVQGLAIGIGLTIFGVPNAALWAMVASIASIMPVIGTPMITIPAILFLYFKGMQWEALGLFVWSGFFLVVIDNILGPYFIAKNSEIPAIFILFSVLGGISLMGPVGALIGPLILSLLYSLVAIYKKETREDN